jgi:hypothetical protein
MKLIHGNILDAASGTIVHQGNARGYMNSGVAKAIRDKWPVVFSDYSTVILQDRDKATRAQYMGTYIVSDVADNLAVCTLIGQDTFGYDGLRYTSYDAIAKALSAMAEDPAIQGPFHFPLLGSDRGGGNWFVIEEIIRQFFPDANIWVLEENKYNMLSTLWKRSGLDS